MRRETEKEMRCFMRNVARLRAEHGLSKREMAKRLGIGVGTLNKLERGQLPARLSVSVIYSIYREFGVLPSQQFADLLSAGAGPHVPDNSAPRQREAF